MNVFGNDKNFVSALGDEIPAIKITLRDLSKVAAAGGPAGPGSIVVRGIGARAGRSMVGAVVGAVTGGIAAGPIGAGVGGLFGASFPEMLTAMFMSRIGAAFLTRTARLGRGELPAARWAVLTQLITRAAGVDIEPQKEEQERENFSPT